jgi:predicted ester cyclase
MPTRSIAFASALMALAIFCVSCADTRDTTRAARASAEQSAHNKTVARRVYEEGLSQGVFEVPYTESFVGHGGAATFTHADGLAAAKGWRSAFPDLKVAVDLIVAENNLVAVRWTARGTNTGVGNGISATGKSVKVSGTTIFRLVDGAIAEEWTSGDSLGLLRQLGLLPVGGTQVAHPD